MISSTNSLLIWLVCLTRDIISFHQRHSLRWPEYILSVFSERSQAHAGLVKEIERWHVFTSQCSGSLKRLFGVSPLLVACFAVQHEWCYIWHDFSASLQPPSPVAPSLKNIFPLSRRPISPRFVYNTGVISDISCSRLHSLVLRQNCRESQNYDTACICNYWMMEWNFVSNSRRIVTCV